MIKDITIGQFFPKDSIVHELDPRVKILLVICFVVVLFMLTNILTLILTMCFILISYKLAKIPLKLILKSIKPLLFIIIFTSVINMFFTKGNIIFNFWKFSISKEGVFLAIVLIIRVVNMVAVSALLTYTTSPIELTYALEKLMKPLKFFKIPVNDIAMMMTISLRFVPTLIQETDKIMLAQKARGAKIDTGNIFQRVKSFIPVIIPLFISAFRAAEELAVAMECRCYNGGKGKTSMKQLNLHKNDVIISSLIFVFFVLLFIIDKFEKILF